MRWLLAALLVGALSIDFVTGPASGQSVGLTTSGSEGSSTGPTYPTTSSPASTAPAVVGAGSGTPDTPSVAQTPRPDLPAGAPETTVIPQR